MKVLSFGRLYAYCSIYLVLFANAERVFFAFAIRCSILHENVKTTLRANVKKTLWLDCKRKENVERVLFEFAILALALMVLAKPFFCDLFCTQSR